MEEASPELSAQEGIIREFSEWFTGEMGYSLVTALVIADGLLGLHVP